MALFRSGVCGDGCTATFDLPRLGERRLPCARSEAHRKDAAALVVAATELKRTSTADTRPMATVLAVGVIVLVDDLLEHNLTGHRAKLTDAAHFGQLIARVDEANRGGLTPAAAAVLSAIGAQFNDADKLFEQLCRWTLEAGYYTARTGADPDEVLEVLRAEMARIVRGLALPPQRHSPPQRHTPAPSLPAPRRAAEERAHH
jgi:hypothetical protein